MSSSSPLGGIVAHFGMFSVPDWTKLGSDKWGFFSLSELVPNQLRKEIVIPRSSRRHILSPDKVWRENVRLFTVDLKRFWQNRKLSYKVSYVLGKVCPTFHKTPRHRRRELNGSLAPAPQQAGDGDQVGCHTRVGFGLHVVLTFIWPLIMFQYSK